MPKKKPKKRKPKVVTTSAPTKPSPVRKVIPSPGINVEIWEPPTDVPGHPLGPGRVKKKPLVPKRGRQKRRGLKK